MILLSVSNKASQRVTRTQVTEIETIYFALYLAIIAIQTGLLSVTSSVQILFESPYLWDLSNSIVLCQWTEMLISVSFVWLIPAQFQFRLLWNVRLNNTFEANDVTLH